MAEDIKLWRDSGAQPELARMRANYYSHISAHAIRPLISTFHLLSTDTLGF